MIKKILYKFRYGKDFVRIDARISTILSQHFLILYVPQASTQQSTDIIILVTCTLVRAVTLSLRKQF